jgi:hypothetical protein
MHKAEPLVPKPNAFEFEMAAENLRRHKLPNIDQIQAEFITARGRTIHSEIHKVVHSIWDKKGLSTRWKESMYLLIRRVTKQTIVITEAYKFVYYTQNFIQYPAVEVNSIHRADDRRSSAWISTRQVNC